MISRGETLTSAKSVEPLSRRTSSIVRLASTSVHTDTCGAVYAERTMPDATALRTPRTGIDSSRASAGAGAGVAGAAGRVTADTAGSATAMVSSRTSGHCGVSMLRNTLACDACRTTSSRVTSPAVPLGTTSTSSTPRSRASLRIGGFATTPTDAATGRCAGRRRRDSTCPAVP